MRKVLQYALAGPVAVLLTLAISGAVIALVGAVVARLGIGFGYHVHLFGLSAATVGALGVFALAFSGVGGVLGMIGREVSSSLTTMTLFRAVGNEELKLIETADWRKFPPRLADQPVFYPTTDNAVAARNARDWSLPNDQSAVVRFEAEGGPWTNMFLNKPGDHRHDEKSWMLAEILNPRLRSRLLVTERFTNGRSTDGVAAA